MTEAIHVYLLKKVYNNDIIISMLKKVLLFLFVSMMLPVMAGDVEDALDKGHNVFLYLYSPRCKYCTKFTATYKKLIKQHDGEFAFFKIDSESKYGRSLMYEFSARYVPYVVLLNSNKGIATEITPVCLLDTACLENSMKAFRSK